MGVSWVFLWWAWSSLKFVRSSNPIHLFVHPSFLSSPIPPIYSFIHIYISSSILPCFPLPFLPFIHPYLHLFIYPFLLSSTVPRIQPIHPYSYLHLSMLPFLSRSSHSPVPSIHPSSCPNTVQEASSIQHKAANQAINFRALVVCSLESKLHTYFFT